MLDDADKRLLADFIGENWAQFLAYCDEMGYDEADADDIYATLNKPAEEL